MLPFIIIIVETLLVVVLFLLTKKYYSEYSKKTRRIFATLSLLLFHVGIALIFLFSNKLNSYGEYKTWGRVTGTIVSAKVIGIRAFRPDIQYEYLVEGTRYTGTSFLNVPGFGGRSNRRDAAHKLVNQFGPGKKLTVFFNPQKPKNSLLKISPPYSVYVQLAFAATFFAVFLYFLLVFTYNARKKK